METQTEIKLELNKICHACLSINSEIQEFTNRDQFLQFFQECTSSEVIDEDSSLSLCVKCVQKVEEFYTFREMCRKSHLTIQTILTDPEKIAVCDNNRIFVVDKEQINEETNEIQDIVFEEVLIPEEKPKIENVPEKIENYKCVICRLSFDNKKSIKKHNDTIHCTKDYKCLICEESFTYPHLIQDHMKIHKNTYKPDDKIFSCARCDRPYKGLQNLQIHIYSHLGILPYKCQFCFKGFTKATSLKIHEDLHTGTRKHLCAQCGKGFSYRLELRRHQMSHTGSRPFKCKLCPISVNTITGLNVHMRIHTGEKPFLCSTCGKSFRRVNHLNVHKRIHTGEKPFKCSFCDKCFAQSGDRRIHERLHTGVKPYVCEVCNKAFNQSHALTTHLKKHDTKPWSCDHCGRVFLNKGSLDKHEVSHKGACKPIKSDSV